MTSAATADVHAALQASRLRLEPLAGTSPRARALIRLLATLQRRLAAPPRVVLLGEFNSGKSTLANALIGAEALPTSIHANTRVPLHARYSTKPSVTLELSDGRREPLTDKTIHHLQAGRVRVLHVGLAVPRLELFELLDTPGLASGTSRPDALVVEACRRAHVAVWCTASTQAWKATEAQAWSELPPRLRRRSLLVATLADALNTNRDRERVEARLRAEAGPHFSSVVLVAAAEVEELRRNPNSADFAERWSSCGGEALDQALQRILQGLDAERTISTQRVLTRVAQRLRA